jgi:uncharacterized protein YndB with AHSA1/START domain
MITKEDDGLWVTMEESIALHYEEVFACLTTVAGLTRWFCLSAEIDLRSGGTIVFGWDPKLERKTTIAILEFDPGGRVTWDWYAANGDTHAPVYWEVQPSTEKGAIVRLRQGPFKPDLDHAIRMAEEAQTWRWHLCNLRTTLEVKHDMRKVRPL